MKRCLYELEISELLGNLLSLLASSLINPYSFLTCSALQYTIQTKLFNGPIHIHSQENLGHLGFKPFLHGKGSNNIEQYRSCQASCYAIVAVAVLVRLHNGDQERSTRVIARKPHSYPPRSIWFSRTLLLFTVGLVK